ncbi:MAG: hypothetical protein IJD94_03855 [Clostridia bacterium]|nr:hypothetical protein [Clostridia bacterium]
MKRRILAAVLLLLSLLSCAAAAQELPGVECFSPGLVRLSEIEAKAPAMIAEAENVNVVRAGFARDLSVLSGMLEGMTIRYEAAPGGELLSFVRDGETLGVYDLPKDGQASDADALLGALAGRAVLERVQLEEIAGWLEGLSAGDELLLGFSVAEPFVLRRTRSDDGTRLTRIDFEAGGIARGDEAAWQVTGFMRQPAGRAPKDTFELVIKQDEKNFMELSYSSTRSSEITKKNAAGTARVTSSVKAAGKLAGSGISSRLSVTTKNAWTADGENLNEKITVTATLNHQDNTPGRRMQRLNAVEAETKHVIGLATREGDDDAVELSDQLTLTLKLDGNTYAEGGMDVGMRVGGEASLPDAEARAWDEEAVRELAAAVYAQLDADVKEKIQTGLNDL